MTTTAIGAKTSVCAALLLTTFLTTALSGCALEQSASRESARPTPTQTPLVFDNDPLQCLEPSGSRGESVGYCMTMTAQGMGEDYKVGDIRGPWFQFSWLCQVTGPSDVSISGGPSLLTHFTNPEADFKWDPKLYPTITISIDQGPKRDISYSTRNMYGVSQPDSISLLANNPDFMRDLAGASTLQLWARDADGVNHEMVFNVDGNVSKVAELSAKGYTCEF